MKNFAILLISFFGIIACSSAPQVKLYSLSLPSSFTPIDNDSNKFIHQSDTQIPIIQIAPVMLATYLNSRNLIIQMKNYQINVANNHLWAEDLDVGIAKSLVYKLQALDKNYYFLTSNDFTKQKPSYTLQLTFDAFHANDQSIVISKGKYNLLDKDNNVVLSKNFTYRVTQTQNGYLDTVIKLDETLNSLAANINAAIQQNLQP